MSDDSENSYTSDEDYNNDDGSHDEGQHDDEYPEDEYAATNDKFYDEHDRQLTKFHSEASSHNHDDSQGGDNSTNVTKPIPTVRSLRSSYLSAAKQSEEEVEIANRKPVSPRRNYKQRNDGNKIERRSHNASGLVVGRSGGSSRTQSGRSSGDVERYNSESNQDQEMDFPLRNIAAGVTDNTVSIRDARALEMFAKKNLKLLKADLQIAQLDVAEAKLAEFAAKLQARQVKIHERHAKLCKRRALLKQAEDDQTALERKLNEEEDDHRDRERRVKNRERRVKQEEAGLRIKEAALRKREIAVSQGIERIERWREIVEEKEKVHKQMEDILQRKQEIQGRSKSSRNSGIFSSGTRRSKHSELKSGNGGEEHTRKQDIIGQIISGIRRQQIVGAQATKGSREIPNPSSPDIKSGAPSIWL